MHILIYRVPPHCPRPQLPSRLSSSQSSAQNHSRQLQMLLVQICIVNIIGFQSHYSWTLWNVGCSPDSERAVLWLWLSRAEAPHLFLFSFFPHMFVVHMCSRRLSSSAASLPGPPPHLEHGAGPKIESWQPLQHQPCRLPPLLAAQLVTNTDSCSALCWGKSFFVFVLVATVQADTVRLDSISALVKQCSRQRKLRGSRRRWMW